MTIFIDEVSVNSPQQQHRPQLASSERSRYEMSNMANLDDGHVANEDFHHGQPTSNSSFLAHILAPASDWYKEIRSSRRHDERCKSRHWELVVSYLLDWIVVVLIAGLLQMVDKVYGFRREFSLTDTSIQHTYALDERISVSLLAVFTFVIPLVLIAIFSLGISRNMWDLHAGALGLVAAHAFTLTATTVVKVCVGRPRPDFIDRCQPRLESHNASPYGLSNEGICTANVNSRIIQDGFRSFPSGHSSAAFAGLTFLTFWFAGKFHLWQKGRGNAFTSWISFLPMIGAILISVSRTMDYRHHATDVIAGGILGFLVAVSSYHTYYPPLWCRQSHKPWMPRTLSLSHGDRPNQDMNGDNVDLERAFLHRQTFSCTTNRVDFA